jgi:hypothetical protein
MKFWLAWLAYGFFGVLLACGMILAHAGNAWLLLFALGLYGVLFGAIRLFPRFDPLGEAAGLPLPSAEVSACAP